MAEYGHDALTTTWLLVYDLNECFIIAMKRGCLVFQPDPEDMQGNHYWETLQEIRAIPIEIKWQTNILYCTVLDRMHQYTYELKLETRVLDE